METTISNLCLDGTNKIFHILKENDWYTGKKPVTNRFLHNFSYIY